MKLALAGELNRSFGHAAPDPEDCLRVEVWQSSSGRANSGETLQDSRHPRESVYYHQIDETAAEDVPNQAAYVMWGVSLIDEKLDASNQNVDEQKRKEEPERVGLNSSRVVSSSSGELRDDSIKGAHDRSAPA
jgi:hypothetical protein